MYRRAIESSGASSSSDREDDDDQDGRKMFVVKMLKMLTGLQIKFVHMAGDMPLAFGRMQTDAPSIFNESILLSIQSTPLRTLDLMHVAAARYARQRNSNLGAFVTGDAELLAMKEPHFKITGLPFLSPSEYVQALGLK